MATFAGVALLICLVHRSLGCNDMDGVDKASGYYVKLWGQNIWRPCATGMEFSNTTCGCVTMKPETILGRRAKIDDVPWALSMTKTCIFFWRCPDRECYMCNAVLIGPIWALSASRCFDLHECGYDEKTWVYGGSAVAGSGGNSIRARAIRIYHNRDKYGDIMLMKLDREMYRANNLKPVGIDLSDRNHYGARCTRAAFEGLPRGTIDGYLYQGDVKLLPRSECLTDKWKHSSWSVCVEETNPLRFPSEGAIGSGLVCTNEKGEMELLGLLSETRAPLRRQCLWGRACLAAVPRQSMYVSVAHFQEFMNGIILHGQNKPGYN